MLKWKQSDIYTLKCCGNMKIAYIVLLKFAQKIFSPTNSMPSDFEWNKNWLELYWLHEERGPSVFRKEKCQWMQSESKILLFNWRWMLQQGFEGQWEISQHKSKGVGPYLVSQQKPANESSLVPFPNLFRVIPPHEFKLACRFTRMDGYYF